jgi:hypothetical protein
MPPLDPGHEEFQNEVVQWLENQDFIIVKQPYHDVMPDHVTRILQGRWSLTALYLRGRSDRLAIHKFLPVEFEWEVKTTPEKSNWLNCSLEAWPLVHHIAKARLGVDCLYLYKNLKTDEECGFWMNNLPEVHKVKIPPRPEYDDVRDLITDELRAYFPRARFDGANVQGTGDPFVIILRSVIQRLPHWQDLILAELDGF